MKSSLRRSFSCEPIRSSTSVLGTRRPRTEFKNALTSPKRSATLDSRFGSLSRNHGSSSMKSVSS